ncbi:MAG: hypothetical protein H0V45_02535 [Actinobacteria bacterium]|nr:hypothetical protein [Actinomycetota bacterium]
MRFSLSPNDRRIHDLVVALDRTDGPIAETWRLVGEAAARLGLLRPGYHQVRLLARADRERRDAGAKRRKAELQALLAFGSPRATDLSIAIHLLREAQRAEEFVLKQHELPRNGPD